MHAVQKGKHVRDLSKLNRNLSQVRPRDEPGVRWSKWQELVARHEAAGATHAGPQVWDAGPMSDARTEIMRYLAGHYRFASIAHACAARRSVPSFSVWLCGR